MKSRRYAGVPHGVIKRLPLYYRILKSWEGQGVERVSSSELAERAGVKSTQIRHDLSIFGSFGQQGYGYRVSELKMAVEKILGLDKDYRMVVIGAGNIGSAVAHYPSFKQAGVKTVAIFDNDPGMIGSMISGLVVQDVADLPHYLKKQPIDIGVISTPSEAAPGVARVLVAGGVRGIWNFAPVRLEVPSYVSLEHIHLGESLFSLVFQLNQGLSDEACEQS